MFRRATEQKPKLEPLISTKTFKSLQDIKAGDSLSNAIGKLYALMKEHIEADKEQEEIDSLFEEDREADKTRRHKEILAAVIAPKEKKKEPKPEDVKVPKEKGPEAPKAAPKAKAEKVEKPAAPKAAEAPKAKAEAVPSKPAEIPKPAAEPAIPSTPKPPSTKPSTMAQAAVGAAAVTAIAGYDYAKNMIKRHEGSRNRPYKDSLGLWTVGIGHLIGDGKTLPKEWDREFTQKEINDLYEKDFAEHQKAAEKIPGYNNLNEKGKSALIDLTFNMGPKWYQKWPNFTRQLQDGDIEGAAKNLEGSIWYKQVGKRGPEIVALLRDGKGSSSTTTTVPPPVEKGTQLSESSIQNKDLKKSNGGGTTVVNNNTNVVAMSGPNVTNSTNKINEKPVQLQG
jgi:lysozyme